MRVLMGERVDEGMLDKVDGEFRSPLNEVGRASEPNTILGAG